MMQKMIRMSHGLWLLIFLLLTCSAAQAEDLWVTYQGTEGPGVGTHIVLISGDDEYRSEEALPQLGKILAARHGFTCTVLFAIDPATGEIKPDYQKNIPGLEHLADADLMIIAARFRDLPDEQMACIDAYLKAGKPVIGMRTSTHAFNLRTSDTYKHYSFNFERNTEAGGGFGRQILGETWINHHGHHKHQSTRGIIAPTAEEHPIARGIAPGSIWGPTDVYGIRLPQPVGCEPIILGAVLEGMSPDDAVLEGEKNDPMIPVAWTKTHESEAGNVGRVFTTTMGAATDLVSEGTRRMLVNATYWTLGMEGQIPEAGTAVELVGEYTPSPYGFGVAEEGKDGYVPGRLPSFYAMQR